MDVNDQNNIDDEQSTQPNLSSTSNDIQINQKQFTSLNSKQQAMTTKINGGGATDDDNVGDPSIINQSTNAKIESIQLKPPSCKMASNLPPHHHIRGDDTHELENTSGADNFKSSRRSYYSDSSDRTKLPIHQRIVAYLRVKSRLLSCSLYFLVIFLSLAVLFSIAIVIYHLLTIYYHRQTISIDTGELSMIVCFPKITKYYP